MIETFVKIWAFVAAQSAIIKIFISLLLGALAVAIWIPPVQVGLIDKSQPSNGVTVSSTGQTGGQTANVINNYGPGSTPSRIAHIALERIVFFYVQLDADTYQIGVVVRLYNQDAQPRLLTALDFAPFSFQMAGRGSAHLQKFFLTGLTATNSGSLAVSPSSYAELKFLLPLKWQLKLNGPQAPDLVPLSPLSLVFDGDVQVLSSVGSHFYANYPRPVTSEEWQLLLGPRSQLRLDELPVENTPQALPANAANKQYILFNRDRTATIYQHGFQATDYRRNENGVVVISPLLKCAA